MSKRAILPLALGILILSLPACLGSIGKVSHDPTDEPDAAATDSPGSLIPAVAPGTSDTSTSLVAKEGNLFLQLIEPAETEVITGLPSLTVVGRTRVDAVVTIDDTWVEPNIDGEFALEVPLEEGPNIVEVVASVATGEQMDLVLVAIYVS